MNSAELTFVPLTLDHDGRAKVPMVQQYWTLRPADNDKHDWKQAAGLGIVLGLASGNLGAIDVDEPGLADFLGRELLKAPNPPLMCRTPRPGLHIYTIETKPSPPRDLEVRYQGRPCLVQLLGGGCQVAAPPTAGYRWVNPDAEPAFGDLAEVWQLYAFEYRLYTRLAKPWSCLRRERSRGPTTAELREAFDVG